MARYFRRSFVYLFLSLLYLSSFAASSANVFESDRPPLFKCPSYNQDPKVVTVPSSGSQLIVRLGRAEKDQACLLLHLSPTSDDVDMNDITLNSPTINFHTIEVARAYNEYEWERVAGPYSRSLSVNEPCPRKYCRVTIPLTKNARKGKFVLLTLNHSLPSKREVVSRFLHQASFGPTKTMLDNWNYNSKRSIRNWVWDQMNENLVPPTYHREIFRKGSSFVLRGDMNTEYVEAKHPCSKNARWRNYSFSLHDYFANKRLNLRYIDGTPGGPCLITLNDVPRTILNECKDVNGNDLPEFEDTVLCFFQSEEQGKGVAIEDENGSCHAIKNGNPPIKLTQDIMEDKRYSEDMNFLNLPGPIDEIFTNRTANSSHRQSYSRVGAGYALKREITGGGCGKLPYGFYTNTFGIIPGSDELVWFGADPKLSSNTIERPIIDNGLSHILQGSMCPSAPRTYLNVDQCRLTFSQQACGKGAETKVMVLDDELSSKIYKATNRYVYAIEGLRLDDEPTPCTLLYRHRWKLVEPDGPCSTPEVDLGTRNTLYNYLTGAKRSWTGQVLDVFRTSHPSTCDATDPNTKGMLIFHQEYGCMQHVHQDELNVYDFTRYTLPHTHPGNEVDRENPIKKFAKKNIFRLPWPTRVPHGMLFWTESKEAEEFEEIGTYGSEVEFKELPRRLKLPAVAEIFDLFNTTEGNGVIVCGSHGEINNPGLKQDVFSFFNSDNVKSFSEWPEQKKHAWSMTILSADDQLRQRMAWALNELLVITPNQIDDSYQSEIYLNYYDIFVRNAFGNYWDILKEVSYSPMMAEMLSFLDSKSTAYILRTNGQFALPDENYAREIMQLFTVGLYQLRMDGSVRLDSDGNKIATYDNSDIQTFAKVWTGFRRQQTRSNAEHTRINRMDPMEIVGAYRDVFPKMNLNNGFIGDTYPLCTDLPNGQFLRKGAKYRLLGSSKLPDLMTDPSNFEDNDSVLHFKIRRKSKLYKKLCNRSNGKCQYKQTIRLKKNLDCFDSECGLNTVRVIEMKEEGREPIYYEYIRPPCVELAFYTDDATKIAKRAPNVAMCGNKKLEVAQNACCTEPRSPNPLAREICRFTGERMTFNQANRRCENKYPGAKICDWSAVTADEEFCTIFDSNAWYWTNANCEIRVKVTDFGQVAIVHEPNVNNNDKYKIDILVDPENINYFKVLWKDDEFPSLDNNCANNLCVTVPDGCLCDIEVRNRRVFKNKPTIKRIKEKLKVGAPNPARFDGNVYYRPPESGNGIKIFHKSGGKPYDVDTVFGIKYLGNMQYFRNLSSSVYLTKSNGSRSGHKFRNPPHFLNFANPDTRDAMHETDAALYHYFHHKNVPPFLAFRFIQRFGTSNPSPRYVRQVAMAFKKGRYRVGKRYFGDGKYGNLKAMLAAVLLDREARTVVLDADPGAGAIKEPLINLMGFLRAMEFKPNEYNPEISLMNLMANIGQGPHALPNVFSFFLPSYPAPGQIQRASLVAPEAQIMTSPAIVNFINGAFSMVELGLTHCFGGFGHRSGSCYSYKNPDYSREENSRAILTYTTESRSAKEVVDELALLLTAGRLNDNSRKLLEDAYTNSDGHELGLKSVQKLIMTAPEFYSSTVIKTIDKSRPNYEPPDPNDKDYKAIIYVFQAGGADGFNMLVPHSNCENGKNMFAEYQKIRGNIALNFTDLLEIDATSSDQVCNTFGLHSRLPFFQQMYAENDLLFAANVGLLQEPTNKFNWRAKSRQTSLFAHNTQTDEANAVDVFDQAGGRGVLGRILDALNDDDYITGAVSVSGNTASLLSDTSPLFVVDPFGFQQFNSIPWMDDIKQTVKDNNKAGKIGSSFLGDTYSNALFQAMGENEQIFQVMNDTVLDTEFNSTRLEFQLSTIAKMIKTREQRRSNRDIFFSAACCYDTHFDIIPNFNSRMVELDGGIHNIRQEMIAQGIWDDVTIVVVSEFGRTLYGNSGSGSDHAWGGIPFVLGGAVNGGRIIGNFPDDMTLNNDLMFPPGILVPDTPWESFWNGIAQWFGVSDDKLDEVLPNRNKFTDLLDITDIYR